MRAWIAFLVVVNSCTVLFLVAATIYGHHPVSSMTAAGGSIGALIITAIDYCKTESGQR